jgi:hypothetical protein
VSGNPIRGALRLVARAWAWPLVLASLAACDGEGGRAPDAVADGGGGGDAGAAADGRGDADASPTDANDAGSSDAPAGDAAWLACVEPVERPPGEGRVFGANVELPAGADSLYRFAPALAASGDGRVAVVWVNARTDGASMLGAAYSSDGGETFSAAAPPPGAGAPGATNRIDPTLAAWPEDGRLYLGWLSFDLDAASGTAIRMTVEVSLSTDFGASWGDPVRADDPSDSGAFEGLLAAQAVRHPSLRRARR